MKKFSIVALVAIVAAMFTACNNTPKAELKNDVDTLSYAIGLAQSQGLQEYLVQRMGIDSADIDIFVKGLNEGVKAGDDKKKAAYFLGLQIGQQVINQMVPGINREAFVGDSTKTISVDNFLAGFIQGAKGEEGLYTMEKAQLVYREKMSQVRKGYLEKEFKDNKEAGEKYLAENAKKEGVKTLPSGVQYKVITEGKGAIPADTSLVKVNYEGSLIDGTVFDGNWGKDPIAMRANQVIKGWTEVLQLMPVGSEWEVVIPQELAYADREMGAIKPFSALKFKIKLVGIETPNKK